MIVNLKSRNGQWTTSGKKHRAIILYQKGKEFIRDSYLLKEVQNKQTYPQIYMLLQGLEIVLKGILQYTDYDKYSIEVLKVKFGHNIPTLSSEVSTALNIKILEFHLTLLF